MKSRWAKACLVCFPCLLGAGAGYLYQRVTPRSDRNDGRGGAIVIDASDLDLGTIWETAQHRCQFPVRNQGQAPVQVALRNACECVRLVPNQFALSPGEAKVVRMEVNLARLGKAESRRETFPITAEVLETGAKGRMRQAKFVLEAEVRPFMTVQPAVLDFGDPASVDDTKVVDLAFAEPIGRLRAESGSATLNVSATMVGERTARLTATISNADTVRPGAFTIPIAITPELKSGTSLPQAVLAQGHIRGRYESNPEALTIIRDLEEEVVLYSRAGDAFEIGSIDAPASSKSRLSLREGPTRTSFVYGETRRRWRLWRRRLHACCRTRRATPLHCGFLRR